MWERGLFLEENWKKTFLGSTLLKLGENKPASTVPTRVLFRRSYSDNPTSSEGSERAKLRWKVRTWGHPSQILILSFSLDFVHSALFAVCPAGHTHVRPDIHKSGWIFTLLLPSGISDGNPDVNSVADSEWTVMRSALGPQFHVPREWGVYLARFLYYDMPWYACFLFANPAGHEYVRPDIRWHIYIRPGFEEARPTLVHPILYE